MSGDKPSKLPAKVSIHSHQYYGEGWCHALGVSSDGVYAVIEYDDGSVAPIKINGVYSIKFMDSDG